MEREPSLEKQQSEESDNNLPMNVKKNYEPLSSSSSRRSILLPVEEQALSEYVNSWPAEAVQSSIPSNGNIEYLEANPPQSVIRSRRSRLSPEGELRSPSQETILYIRSRSSRRTIGS